MRLGDLDALKEDFADMREGYPIFSDTEMLSTKDIAKIIDNAPTVKFSLMPANETKEDAYKRGYERGKIAGILAANTRPKGEWVVEKNQFGDILHCSICGARPRRSEYGYDLHDKFCNECGADMRKAEE